MSVGGQRSDALAIAASVACLQISIILADDILDDDPRGAHRSLGSGPVSNMALAFQAASFCLLEFVPLEAKEKNKLRNTLAKAALATASGQHLDAMNLASEDDYWKVVNAKSTPFYAAILKLGSIAGGGNKLISAGLSDLGLIIGQIIQLEDDLDDALAIPANADWLQGRNNLLILFAKTAPHENKERFENLLSEITNPTVLNEAQQILIKSGAVSYCVYQLARRFRLSLQTLENLHLPNPTPLEEILHAYANSLLALLRLSGMELSLSDLLSPNF
jgi:geranylgeranyl pyrophosphate synthase